MTLDKFFEAVLQGNEKSKLNEDSKGTKEYELCNDVIKSINALYEFVESDERLEQLLTNAIRDSAIPVDVVLSIVGSY